MNNCATVIQMDGNLWGGPQLVRNDPNPMNNNGKLFKDILDNNTHLTIGNNLDVCKGSLTRIRKTVVRTEKSILDFFLVCDKLRGFVTEVIIDEENMFTLSNYSSKVKVDSDHNTMIAKFSLEFNSQKVTHERQEYFNFKHKKSQEVFLAETENAPIFIEIFENDDDVMKQGGKWFKELNKTLHKSFKKVRITNKSKDVGTDKLFAERRNHLKNIKMGINVSESEVKIAHIEKEIGLEVVENNRKKINDNFAKLSGPDELVNTNGIWNLKRKIFPKNRETLPSAKKDFAGNLVTTQPQLKQLYLSTFSQRLRSRPMRDDYKSLKELKENLCNERLVLARMIKSPLWSHGNLVKVLKSLKTNKSRDPHGFINGLFKPGVIGNDLLSSVLVLVNKIKDELKIPRFMEFANIVSIYKGKGEKLSLENDRGIFIVNIMRSILMKLVYQDKYEIVDKQMTDSQIGARKNKNIRNHIFVLNAIINDAVHTKKNVDILIYDYRQCFDSLWLEECINDLYDAGITDDQLALIYEANKRNNVAVKTPYGLTERVNIEKIVLQGEVFGPLQCSVQVDRIAKECIEEKKFLFSYKKSVEIPPLSMVDDLACIAESGVKSVEMNSFINTKTLLKKLQFGAEKCHQMCVCVKEHITPQLHISNWKAEKCETSSKIKDVYLGETEMKRANESKYLGDLISIDGKNQKNIMDRKSKGYGIVLQISQMLEEIYFGPFEIEVALTLRKSLFLGGILTNCEAWYGLTASDIKQLELVDESLLRKILSAPSTTPKCMLYLETGCTPIRFIIRSRRLMFLHYILKQDKNSLVSKVFHAQLSNPVQNDGAVTCKEDLDKLQITQSWDEIRNLSKYSFRKIVREKIHQSALKTLVQEQKNLSKVKHFEFKNLRIQEYLLPNKLDLRLSKFVFLLRSRMLDVRCNYRNKYADTLCPLCLVDQDTQQHLMVCTVLEDSEVVVEVPVYEQLFQSNVDKLCQIATILKKKFEKRQEVLKNNITTVVHVNHC